MNNKKTIGIVLMVIGVILLVASVAADMIGIGAASGFGWKQIVGSIAGIAVAVVGFFMAFQKQ